MDLQIIPIEHSLDATVQLPGSKSLTNRALLVASLAEGRTNITNALFSDDSIHFADSLQKLGFDVITDHANSCIRVAGLGGKIPVKAAELFVGNAGTAARFLTALLTLGYGEYILDGDARMRERPIGDLVTALGRLGAKIVALSSEKAGTGILCPPIKIFACGLHGGLAEVAGDISSQFLSGLLMVAPYAGNCTELVVGTELNSKPYVDLTLGVMSDFGIDIIRHGYERFTVYPSHYQPRPNYPIETDATTASYFFAAPAILGGRVRVKKINRSSRQGDIAFLHVLEKMGCAVIEGEDHIDVIGTGILRGVDIDMRDISDTAQTLAVIAPFATTPTRITGIGFIRNKESNRITDTCAELKRLGVVAEEKSDGMVIQPCSELHPAIINTHNDHRMAMAFSLIGLRIAGLSIENPTCVSKTFPDFFRVLETLR